jgi:hypothetical protein
LAQVLAPNPSAAILDLPADLVEQPLYMKALETQHFGIVPGQKMHTIEVHGLPTTRVMVEGTRTCIILLAAELAQHARAELKQDKRVTLQQAQEYLEDMQKDALQGYMAAGYKVWHCTVGPGDLLFLPACAIVAEATLNKQDVLGFKRSYFLNVATSIDAFKWMSEEADDNGLVAKTAMTLIEKGVGAAAAIVASAEKDEKEEELPDHEDQED